MKCVRQNCITQLFIPPTGYYVEAHVGISGLLICMKTVPKLVVEVRVIVGLCQLINSFIHTASKKSFTSTIAHK